MEASFLLCEEEPLDAGKAWEGGAGAVAEGAARSDAGFAGDENSSVGVFAFPPLLDDVSVRLGPTRDVRSERWLGRTELRPNDYMRTLVGDDEFVQPKSKGTTPRSECRLTFKNALTQPRLLEMDEKPAIRTDLANDRSIRPWI